MSAKKREFTGKEVTDAIRAACESFDVPQEMLDIEVIETGSTGIFGLIRKKAKIRVAIKTEGDTGQADKVEAEAGAASTLENDEEVTPQATSPAEVAVGSAERAKGEDQAQPEAYADDVDEDMDESVTDDTGDDDSDDDDEDDDVGGEDDTEASEEGLGLVRSEVVRLVELMGYPSTVDVVAKGMSVNCSIKGEHEEELAGPEGKTLDAIQYLTRKIVARKTNERLRITINVGNFRERRLEELKERAIELAKAVRETGKTQVLPALNPSERREIHMVLQEDKEVRSRSVGDGLFKKILIYKPGKGNRGGRRRPNPRNRRNRGNRNSGNSGDQ